ncbi:MAG: hypothetical protein JSW23_08845 [Planctomycetota bacterium]|nr:MAG: hypothetical protein JSW23_08845 [Planctomycetota bacterium]
MDNNFNRRDFLKAIGLSTAALTMPEWSLGDPFPERTESVFARGQTRVYRGEYLTAISLPIGGIGAGCIQINGKAERHAWQIFNNFTHAILPDSFLAVRVRAKSEGPVIRALQTSPVGPFEAMKDLSFRGEYPFGWYEFEDDKLPVKLSMETFNPLIPLNEKDSAIPCAIFNLKVMNPSSRLVEVSLLATQKNAVGFTGTIRSPGPKSGTVMADFESSDYGDWLATGEAFGAGPARGAYSVQQLKGFRGKGLVNTYWKKGDGPTGTLTSQEFTIDKKYIHFLVAGGDHPSRTCINLLVDGQVVRTRSGDNSDAMDWATWDLSELRDKKAQIQIVDDVDDWWGHIDVDHIVISDEPLAEAQLIGLGQNRNRVMDENNATILHMTSDMGKDASGYGDMALAVLEEGAEGTASWESLDDLRDQWAQDGRLTGPKQAGPSGKDQTLNGALAVPLQLGPGQERTVRFALVWYFPNARHGDKRQQWQHEGNMYTNFWSDALDAARYLKENMDRLTERTRSYHRTFYSGNLPHWMLDRMSSQVAVLRSKTCFWAKSGYFGAWEGCSKGTGCCHGNCAHVWHYAQAHARLFPSIARRMREQSLRYQRNDGAIPFRHPGGNVAFDGQCGEILGGYREYLCSSDNQWFDTHWPRYKKAMDYIIATWDKDEDGILAGPQHNTLDGELGGSTTWLGSLYLAALETCEKMAEIHGDNSSAKRYRSIRQSGASRQNETLWNGEYYIQIPDAEPERDYNNGCHIDQVLGEWWANQVGLEPHYPADRVRSAMKSLLKYNFRTNFRGVEQLPRKFVGDDDAGMQMITWPGKDRPKDHMTYADEAMTGFEYAAAATMVQYGMLKEGFLVTRAIYDRYDGRLRTGLTNTNWASWGYSGNPFGDDECGKFYARAMSVWSILLASQGFIYDGPAGVVGFKPIWQPDDHSSFFTAAEGWGLFTQKRTKLRQTEQIEVKHGKLAIRKLVFELEQDVKLSQVTANMDNKGLPVKFSLEGLSLEVTLSKAIVLEADSVLNVDVKIG